METQLNAPAVEAKAGNDAETFVLRRSGLSHLQFKGGLLAGIEDVEDVD